MREDLAKRKKDMSKAKSKKAAGNVEFEVVTGVTPDMLEPKANQEYLKMNLVDPYKPAASKYDEMGWGNVVEEEPSDASTNPSARIYVPPE